jgi:hypothetical protein
MTDAEAAIGMKMAGERITSMNLETIPGRNLAGPAGPAGPEPIGQSRDYNRLAL